MNLEVAPYEIKNTGHIKTKMALKCFRRYLEASVINGHMYCHSSDVNISKTPSLNPQTS